MDEKELLSLNQQGVIPGPGESEEEFKERAEEILRQEIAGPGFEWVRHHLLELFDFQPSVLPILYSNEGLAPWQGAVCWIKDKKTVLLQMREDLRKGSYLRIYQRDEMIAHEAVHAARSAFDESKNEEFFAFMASEKKWRRVLGPIFRRPWEVWPFFLLLMGVVISEWIALYVEGAEIAGGFCLWGAFLWLGGGLGRLIRQHWVLRRASLHLMTELKEEKRVRAVLFRLTDEEIDRFAKEEKIAEYVEKQTSLRWKVIRLAYFR